jgi:hypothetical protein
MDAVTCGTSFSAADTCCIIASCWVSSLDCPRPSSLLVQQHAWSMLLSAVVFFQRGDADAAKHWIGSVVLGIFTESAAVSLLPCW